MNASPGASLKRWHQQTAPCPRVPKTARSSSHDASFAGTTRSPSIVHPPGRAPVLTSRPALPFVATEKLQETYAKPTAIPEVNAAP